LFFFRSYRAKLQAVFLALGLVAIALTGWEASAGSAEALRHATTERLTAIRQTRGRQVERYFQDLGSHVLALSTDEAALRAIEEFSQAWTSLPPAMPGGPEEHRLRAHYANFEPSWFPREPRVVTLQDLLIASNPYPADAKGQMLEAPGAYGRLHARYHPTFHRYQSAFGLYDIFLIEGREARVLYTVSKENDLGVRLDQSPYRESALGKAFHQAMALKEPEQFVLRDYEPYLPSRGAPAAFVAAPVWRAGFRIGVLVMQVSIREVNRVMTADGSWQAEGLGNTGQAYIVGPDNLLRSDLRQRLEAPEEGTGVLRIRVAPGAAIPGTESGLDPRGIRMLRSHGRVNVPGLNWAVIAEIEEREAFAPVRELRNRILGMGLLVAGGFWIAAALMARSVTRPVLALARGAQRLGHRDFDTRLPVTSTDEIGQLAESFNRMAEDLAKTTVSKEELERLAGRLITAQEDERRRIARELHDDLTQRLAAIAIEAGRLARLATGETAEGLARIKQQMARISDDIHDLSRNLHPASLDDLGLTAAIETECRAFFERGGPPVDFEARDRFDDLPAPNRLALYRIVQEALRNILKHAAAESVEITLERDQTEVHLTIRDQGRGFDRRSAEWRAGVGLASMEERTRLLSGRFVVSSIPGEGTKIDVWLPLG
jgi:methyl-accepting chemotaxis protein